MIGPIFLIALFSSLLVLSQAFQGNLNSNALHPLRFGHGTQVRQSQLRSAVDVISNIDTFYRTAPYEAAFVTCGVKASCADFLAQKRELKTSTNTGSLSNKIDNDNDVKTEEQVEIQRNLAFIIYGGIYQGICQYYIYNVLFPLWFGTGNDLTSVAIKVAFDMLVISPFLCLPIAYLTKSTIYGQSIREGFEKYVYDLKNNNLWVTYCSIWLPVQCVTFGLVPEHLRIPFIALVSFFWLIILSTISSTSMDDAVEDA